MHPAAQVAATEASKSAWPWAAVLTVLAGFTLNDWVLTATLIYTVLQIVLSLRKLLKKEV